MLLPSAVPWKEAAHDHARHFPHALQPGGRLTLHLETAVGNVAARAVMSNSTKHPVLKRIEQEM